MVSLPRGLRLGLNNQRRGPPAGGEIPVNEPSESDGEADGLDQGTMIYDGGFADAPTIINHGNGKRVGGTTSNFAKFLFSIGVPEAGALYTMTYDPDFSGLSQGGDLAMVGFGFKQAKKYHFAGLRGDGNDGLNAYKVSGNNFSNLKATDETDGGAATNGTQAGPNWLQIEIAEDGSTYTLRTSADGETWDDEFIGDLPDPLSASTSAEEFGIAIYLDAADKGAFEVDITLWQQVALTVPAQFGTGDWSVADDETGGDITITVTTLPDDGGSALTDLEYQIDGGAGVSLGDTVTGDYPVSGLTDDVEISVAIRAVNAVGTGTASATKAVTPTTSNIPAELGSPAWWLDVADLTTMWEGSAFSGTQSTVGSVVGSLADKVGAGTYGISQPTAANKPILRQDAGGFYYLELDGVNDNLGHAVGNTPCGTVIAVAQIDTGTDIWTGLVTRSSDTGTGVYSALQRDNTDTSFRTNQGSNGSLADSTHIWNNQVQTAAFTLDEKRVYSADGTGHPSSLVFVNGMRVGQAGSAPTSHLLGRVYGLVGYSTVLSTADRNTAEAYLATRYGVTI